MQITTFSNDKDAQGQRHEVTWEYLKAWLSQPYPCPTPVPVGEAEEKAAKSLLPMWSSATFKGNYRNKDNVELVHTLNFDVDEAPIPTLDHLVLGMQGAEWWAHSSARATIAAPRWRLIIALSRPVTRAEYEHLWRVVVERLPFKVGASSKDPSRAWYWPRRGVDQSFQVGGS